MHQAMMRTSMVVFPVEYSWHNVRTPSKFKSDRRSPTLFISRSHILLKVLLCISIVLSSPAIAQRIMEEGRDRGGRPFSATVVFNSIADRDGPLDREGFVADRIVGERPSVSNVVERVSNLRPGVIGGKVLSDNTTGEFGQGDLIGQVFLNNVLNMQQPKTAYDTSVQTASQWILPAVSLPPRNYFIPNSAWPAPHGSSYAQASTTNCGPTESDDLTQDFLQNVHIASDPINLLYTDDNRFVWGVSWTSVIKIDRSTNSLVLTDYIPRVVDDMFGDVFHGAYSILSSEGVFYTAISNRLETYADDPTGEPVGSKIQKLSKEFILPPVNSSLDNSWLKGQSTNNAEAAPLPTNPPVPSVQSDAIRALCMTYNGYLAFASSNGRVGIFHRSVSDPYNLPVAVIDLGTTKGLEGTLEVSNNIACDEDYGIYIVSDKLLHKVKWDGYVLSIIWESYYESGSQLQAARLGTGSGSTPSIMGDAANGRYIVITDGSQIMNVVVFDAFSGELMASHPATFGLENPKTTLSEQSVLVSGWRFAVVNNTPRDKMFSAPGVVPIGQASPVLESVANAWPVIIGDAPYGVQQFEYNPSTAEIRSVWSNPDVSIPNGIPSMSSSKGIMYGIGKRPSVVSKAGPLRGAWTLEGLDWETGTSLFAYTLGVSALYNSVYAATEIGPDCEVITGTLGGVVRVRVIPH